MPLVFCQTNTGINTLVHTVSSGTFVSFTIEYFEVEIAVNRYAVFKLYGYFLFAIPKSYSLYLKSVHQNISSMRGKAPRTVPCTEQLLIHVDVSSVKDELPVEKLLESYVLAHTIDISLSISICICIYVFIECLHCAWHQVSRLYRVASIFTFLELKIQVSDGVEGKAPV